MRITIKLIKLGKYLLSDLLSIKVELTIFRYLTLKFIKNINYILLKIIFY
jgi:hypothetical protein